METPSDRVLSSWREHARDGFIKDQRPRLMFENVHWYTSVMMYENARRHCIDAMRRGDPNFTIPSGPRYEAGPSFRQAAKDSLEVTD